jgi:hypothetical protein
MRGLFCGGVLEENYITYHINQVKPDSSDMISNSLWCVNLGGYLWGDLGG